MVNEERSFVRENCMVFLLCGRLGVEDVERENINLLRCLEIITLSIPETKNSKEIECSYSFFYI